MDAAKLLIGLAVAAVSATATPHLCWGSEEVQGINPPRASIRVIDEKCLDCHNRKRIDEARKEKKDLQEILHRMEKKGATVTPGERQVIGHFWRQNPFKSNE